MSDGKKTKGKDVTDYYLEASDLKPNNQPNKVEFITFKKRPGTTLTKIKTPDHKLG